MSEGTVAELDLGTGYCQIAPIPRCPVHGQMHYHSELIPLGGGISRIVNTSWICKGWDGEGCDHEVNFDDLDWRLIGTAEEMEFWV